MEDFLWATRRALLGVMAGGVPVGNSVAASIAKSNVEQGNAAPTASGQSRFRQYGAGAVERDVEDKLREIASVKDFGAVGDGTTDDSAAFQAAIIATTCLFVPPGRYRLGRTVRLRDGLYVFGTGKSASEPYTEAASFPNVFRSEIIVDGILAFDASNTNSSSIEGLAIKALGGRQSRWGWPAGKQIDAIGIHITGSTQFEARNISFHGLDVAIDANQAVGSADTQMPRISDWMATDCGTVFRFGNASSRAYTVRDARIADCVHAIHCDSMLDAHRCDGLRLENLRLFHGSARSIYIRETPFVSLNAVTIFETGDDQVTLEECLYASLGGLLLARSGAYKGQRPYPQKIGLKLDRCTDVAVSGQIQQSTGKAMDVIGCANVSINCAIGTPFWTTGNKNNLDGAISVRGSTGVNLNASFGGVGRDYWVSVWADLHSAQTLSGSVSSDRSVGVVRGTHLQQQGGHCFTFPAEVKLQPGSKHILGTLRTFIPAGAILKSRAVEMTHFAPQICVQTNVNGEPVIWEGSEELLQDGDKAVRFGSISLEDKPLYDNRSGPGGWYCIELSLRNFSRNIAAIAAGTEVRISTAVT